MVFSLSPHLWKAGHSTYSQAIIPANHGPIPNSKMLNQNVNQTFQLIYHPGAPAHTWSENDLLHLNMGPSHPSTHGVLRIELELDGERIVSARPHIGYLHRGFEKIAEHVTYTQFIPYTDRLDYLAPLANNVAYVLAVEKLLGIEDQIPPRAVYIRTICSELARISSHLLGLGAFAMDCGAVTVFLYQFTEREKIYNLCEALTGARFTTSYTRIGGVARDLPPGWCTTLNKFLDELLKTVDEIDRLLTRNIIWIKRTKNVGVIPPQTAIDYALTGPNLRASGVPLDLRKDQPYLCYNELQFDIPIGTIGDCYDRYLVRLEEIRQSASIIRQCIQKIPGGPDNTSHEPIMISNFKVALPPKSNVMTQMEELIHHFMNVTRGPDCPPGEVYLAHENPKGQLGFYIQSRGGGVPYRLRIRPPSFFTLSILPVILPGHLLADIPAILGSLDFVMGECDR